MEVHITAHPLRRTVAFPFFPCQRHRQKSQKRRFKMFPQVTRAPLWLHQGGEAVHVCSDGHPSVAARIGGRRPMDSTPLRPGFKGQGHKWPPFRPDHLALLWRLEDILNDRLMSDDCQRVEIITGTTRRCPWTAEQKLRIVEESHRSGESISAVARRRGVAANLLYRWRRLTAEEGVAGLSADEGVVSVY